MKKSKGFNCDCNCNCDRTFDSAAGTVTADSVSTVPVSRDWHIMINLILTSDSVSTVPVSLHGVVFEAKVQLEGIVIKQ